MSTVLAWAAVLVAFLVTSSQRAGAQQPVPGGTGRTADGVQFVQHLAAREFPAAVAPFDTAMARAVPAIRLAAIWAQLQTQAGPFQKVLGATVIETKEHRTVTVTCQFEQAALNVIVVFDSARRIEGLFFRPAGPVAPVQAWTPPPYADSATFRRVAVTVQDGKWTLPGTLTIPLGDGPFPAVVLVAGSGPNDQDETDDADKPFKDLAWGLSSRGIAVLRYPKRTHQYGAAYSDDPTNATVKDEYLDDVAAAIALLAHRPDVDPHRIYVIGHSEGGYLAPRIAAANADVAGIVILAGNSRPLEDGLVEQLRYLLPLNGADASTVNAAVAKAQAAKAEAESPSLKSGTVIDFGSGLRFPSSYLLDLRDYHPTRVAAGLHIPILVLQGERDYQVRLADFDGWKRALSGHVNATFKLYPGLTHLFTPAVTPGTGLSTPADYNVPEHVAAVVVGDITTWIHGLSH